MLIKYFKKFTKRYIIKSLSKQKVINMSTKLSEDEFWELIGFIKVSKVKYSILESLDDKILMPSEIANMTGYRTTQISNALQLLKEKNLVRCKNERSRKGRLYQNTPLGSEILKVLKN